MLVNNTERIIVYTRYPEAGLAKTRLIPALGEAGAANLQKLMTEETVKTVQKAKIEFEIHFTGCSFNTIQVWLGNQLKYNVQEGKTLGERISNSFKGAFSEGIKKVLIIGTDCPGITTHHIKKAFNSLQNSDLVLGPARDGGYYLIGLNSFQPELFNNIKWGSSLVYQQTMATARKLHLKSSTLEELVDIDRPEDLSAWCRGVHKI